MRILIVGGSVFVGRSITRIALDRGHRVTLFNRGRENPGLFPEVERIRGDRRTDLDLLKGRTWDAVVDTCGYFPDDVAGAAAALKGRVGSYVFVSSVLVYDDLDRCGLDETARTLEMAPSDLEPAPRLVGATLGPLKAASERALLGQLSHQALIVRCGILVGPHDIASTARFSEAERQHELDYDAFSGRFAYWPMRFARGGSILAPGPAERPLQLLDVRDLAAFIVAMAEQQTTGILNAAGEPIDWQVLVRACQQATPEVRSCPVWVDPEHLQSSGVRGFVELPMWAPSHQGIGVMRIDSTRARAQGLAWRPFVETVADTLSWAQREPELALPASGHSMSGQRESELLQAWLSRRPSASVERA